MYFLLCHRRFTYKFREHNNHIAGITISPPCLRLQTVLTLAGQLSIKHRNQKSWRDTASLEDKGGLCSGHSSEGPAWLFGSQYPPLRVSRTAVFKTSSFHQVLSSCQWQVAYYNDNLNFSSKNQTGLASNPFLVHLSLCPC